MNYLFQEFHFTYVLQSLKDEMFYTGVTNDLPRRFGEHERGENVSTAKRRPLRLIYFEGHLSRVDAERREKYFKTTKGKVTLRYMIRDSIDNKLK